MTDSTAGQNQRIADFIKRQVKAEVAGLLRAEIADLIRRQIKTEVAIAISPLQREITTFKEKIDELKAVVAASSQYEEEIRAYCSQVAASADIIQ